MTWALVSLLGLVAGVVSGLFGVGGAVVIIPGLVLIAKLPQHTAHGTSLAALLLPVGLLGVLEYSKRQQVHRSEEHTSELQSLAYLVCRLLLEKKKQDTSSPYARQHFSSWIGECSA